MIIKNAHILSYGIEEGIYNIKIENNKISQISKNEIKDNDDNIIDAKNMFLTPGLIDAHTHLGLKADGLDDFYSEHNEKNSILSPELRAVDAINPQMKTIIEARNAGVTTCATGPGSINIIGGQYAVVKTAGETIDDMILDPYVAMKVALGENPKKAYNTTRMGIASKLREFLLEAKNYATNPDKYNPKLEPMIPIIKKEKPLKIHCHQANDIVTAIKICEEFNLDYTLDHVTCGVDIINYLRSKPNIPLILGPSLGARSKVELAGKGFENVVELSKGRDICLITDAPVIPLQYLPICVGLAISKGMPFKQALESVTINPARILKLDDRLGSIEVGKDADMVLWKNKPFVTIQDPKLVLLNGNIVFKK